MDAMTIGIVVFLSIIAVIGFFAGKKTKTTDDFAVAGRTLGPLVIAITIVSTYGSASSYIGIGGLGYKFGWPAQWIWIGCLPGIVLPILLLGPKMRIFSDKLKAITVPDFLATRYESKFLRVYVALGIIVFYIPMMVAQFKGVGVLFQTILNIPFNYAILIFGTIIVLYCAVGGLFAVAWTDTIQGLFMAAIMLLLVPISISSVGGWNAMNMKLEAISSSMNAIFEPSVYTPTTAVFIVIFYCLLQMGQPFIGSRFFALKDVKSFKNVVFFVIVFTIIASSVIWGGVAARILYPNLSNADLAVPTLIKNIFPPALASIAVLGILAAMMTTIDALLITVSTAVGYDLYKKVINKNASEKQIFRVTQISTLVAGGIALVFALYKAPAFLSMLVFMALAGVASMVVGPVIVGVYDKRATKEAAEIASVAGTLIFIILINKFNVWITGSIAMLSSIALVYGLSRFIGTPSQRVVNVIFENKVSTRL